MMDLETCRYIDLPGVGVIDLEAPQLPEIEYEPTIMETIASVSKALQAYERSGGFAPAAAEDTEMWPSQHPRLTWSRQKTRPRCRM
jgi:hypothetical protein